MRTPLTTKPAAQSTVRIPKLRVKRSFARRGTRTRPCIELPRRLWDRIVLLMFTCCLFTFLHAFFGFGLPDEDLNDTSVHPRISLSISPPWNRGSVASNGDEKVRVMVDWHGNYGLFPSTASALVLPATTPQDAFPDPTPALVRAERERAPGEGSLSVTTKAKTHVAPTFYGAPYDPFRLVFEDSVDGGEFYGLYPGIGPPRTVPRGARARRSGRYLPEETCL